jgi:hypothetical protein
MDLSRELNHLELKQLANEFGIKRVSLIPNFLTSHSLTFLQKALDSSNIIEEVKRGEGNTFQEQHIDSPKALFVLNGIFQNKKIFHDFSFISNVLVDSVAGGRIYKLRSNNEDQINWHQDDWVKYRLLGFSLNLSKKTFEGGSFEIRELNSNVIHSVHSNPGDLHIFKIDEKLEHRVLPVTGPTARMAYAGWFKFGANT